jgi:hypothetical protein
MIYRTLTSPPMKSSRQISRANVELVSDS